jgi:hypothetical protein
VKIEKQEMSQWCWAAVSVSVDRFFDPATTNTQCVVAEKVLNRTCCPNKVDCNETAFLQVALKRRET